MIQIDPNSNKSQNFSKECCKSLRLLPVEQFQQARFAFHLAAGLGEVFRQCAGDIRHAQVGQQPVPGEPPGKPRFVRLDPGGAIGGIDLGSE